MQLDVRTLLTLVMSLVLVFDLLAIVFWWTWRAYPGYGRWTIAGLLLLLSLFLLSLQHTAPDWISIVIANALLVLASILYLEGACAFRGLPPPGWRVYAGGGVAVGAVAFFRYGVRNLNARALVISAFLGIILMLASIRLLRRIPPAHRFGLTLTGSTFALCAATLIARALYCYFGPPMSDFFTLSGIHGAFLLGISAQMAVSSVGFILLSAERVISDLENAKEGLWRADVEVAQHLQSEAILRESERRFRSLADTAPVMIWVSGPDKLCTFFNKPWLDFTGRTLEQELGEGWASGVHPDDLDRCLKTYASSFNARRSFRMEYRLRRADGEYRWILDHGTPCYQEREFAGFIGSCIDVTEQKLIEERLRVNATALRTSELQLRALAANLLTVQENERRRISQELHDDLTQRLAALAMELGSLAAEFPAGSERLTTRLRALQRSMVQAAETSRHVAYQLHASELDDLGLATSLRAYCEDFGREGITVEFTSGDLPSLNREVASCLYKVTQESLRNVVKHAKTQRAWVTLEGTGGRIVLQVRDAGVGFPVESLGASLGLGVVGMRERVRNVKGSLAIRSAPKQGTVIEVEVPLPGAEPTAW